MPINYHRVTPIALPAASAITRHYDSTDLADAYSIQLPTGTTTDPEILARFIFTRTAPWVTGLMKVRDALVAGLGLKTAALMLRLDVESQTARVGFFKVYRVTETEIVLGEDDKHLDFRLSVLCSARSAPTDEQHLVLSTVVHCHNRLGRIYIFIIAPFHRFIVQSSLRRAARIGWPRAGAESAVTDAADSATTQTAPP